MKLGTAAVVAVALVVGLDAQSGRQEHWVATWATAPVGRALPTPAAAPAASTAAAPAAAPAAAAPAPPATTAVPAAAPGPGGRGQAPGGAPGAGRGGGAIAAPNNQTLRQIVHVSLGGDRVRVVLSNAFGTRPLRIGAAQIALRAQNAAIVPASARPLAFSGEKAISIPPGAMMISDPVSLTVPNMGDLAIDLYLPEDTATSMLTRHSVANQTNYLSNGNVVGTPDLSDATRVQSWYFLARVEVVAPERTPVIVALGDSITDGTRSTVDTNGRWPDVLARRLIARGGTRPAVVNAGISANRVLSDAAGDGGVNILARLDRDALMHSGATHMIFMLGINDIGQARQNPSPSAADLIAGHRQVIARARAQGIKIFGATLTPFEGAAYFTPEGEAKRQAVNQWIRTSKEYDGVVDFDLAMRDPKQPTKFVAEYQAGDWLHPNNAGYEVMGNAVNLDFFK
jgi:lysophospholipase L1-like esterase